jgi:hypothetical protein
MIYTTFKQWVKGRVLEIGQPRKQFYTQEDFDLIEMGWGYGYDAGVEWQKSQTALDKKADNARELGLNYEDQDMIEIEYRLKAQEDDVENTLHWHALNYRTASTENAQAMFEALENYVRAKINENTQERKKWIGLTDADMDAFLKIQRREFSWRAVFLDVEAKLKEKNT